jgi:hypothetical protein
MDAIEFRHPEMRAKQASRPRLAGNTGGRLGVMGN